MKVPPHGFLTARGDDWRCERGYKKEQSSCVELALPENAHLDYSGNRWDCNRGYRREAGACTASDS